MQKNKTLKNMYKYLRPVKISRVASRPCTRPVFRKPAFLKKIWPRKIAGLVTGLEWLGGFECVKKV
jgi:hypothetical protein